MSSATYLRKDKARADPDGGGAQGHCSGQALSVVDTTSSDNLHGLASHWAGLTLTHRLHGWDQDAGRDVTGMSTALATLRANEICTKSKALWYVLGMTDHVHVEDAVLVQTVDNSLGWDTDSRDEELSARVDDNRDELIELALGVVVAETVVSALRSILTCDAFFLTSSFLHCHRLVGSRDRRRKVRSCPSGNP